LTGQPGGIVGNAVQLINAGDAVGYCYTRIDIPNLAALNPQPPFTVEFWAKPTSLSSDSTGSACFPRTVLSPAMAAGQGTCST